LFFLIFEISGGMEYTLLYHSFAADTRCIGKIPVASINFWMQSEKNPQMLA